VRETAAVALGILANPRSIPTLSHLLWDTKVGRGLVGKNEVDYRTRSFAAYGLGLVAARSAEDSVLSTVVSVLRQTIASDDTRTHDLQIACVVALGLAPLQRLELQPSEDERRAPPAERSRLAQIDYLLELLDDAHVHELVRAQCPQSAARLLPGLSPESHEAYRERLAEMLIDLVERDKERPELVQSAVQGLGLLGTNDDSNPLDARIRRTLLAVPRRISEPQARAYALIALAEVGARFGVGSTGGSAGIGQVAEFLGETVLGGKQSLRPWAALACGVLVHGLLEAQVTSTWIEPLRRVVRTSFEDEKDPSKLGAYALGSGLMDDHEAAKGLLKRLEKQLEDSIRGQVALALGLMQEREAIDPLHALLEKSRYRPALLRDGAITLGLLEDKDAVPLLVGLLEEARGQADQAAISTALGFIGDQRSVDPLVGLLANRLATDRARAFAAVALGNVGDKELLPWNTKIALDLNYRAATATLSDPLAGSGILDLF